MYQRAPASTIPLVSTTWPTRTVTRPGRSELHLAMLPSDAISAAISARRAPSSSIRCGLAPIRVSVADINGSKPGNNGGVPAPVRAFRARAPPFSGASRASDRPPTPLALL
eukprot:1057667-Rhodomonas_salina.2